MQPHVDDRRSTGSALAGRFQEALLLWLRWNDAHQRMTGLLYESRQDQRTVEELLDQLDRLRQEAVQLSQELLDKSGQ
jgi:hypothetical protein